MSRRSPRRRSSGELPALARNGLRVVPLGGLGEIGRNMTVFEHAGRLLIVDCGVLFPDEHQPGVDVILPDFTWIRDRLDKIDAIVLTHGHEDHIGGVPYLLRERPDIPVVGSRLTLALLEAKLTEHRITPRTVEVAEEGDRRTFGPFDCEFVAVNHSIPDGLAVAIRTAAGLVLHTGDFKMDQFPLDGRVTDLRAFARLGEEGVDLFLVDSTNAEVPGFTVSEGELAPAIDTVFRTTTRPGHRVELRQPRAPHPADPRCRPAARPQGRLRRALDGAQHGHRPRAGLPHLPRRARRQGPQGPGAAAPRPDDDHRHRVTGRADGRPGPDGQPRPPGEHHRGRHGAHGQLADPRQRERHLPGHQRAHPVGRQRRAQGQRQGARLRPRQRGRARLLLQHHPARRNVLPVHGEWRHLRANADIAIRTGVDAERVLIAQDGSVIDLVDGRASITGTRAGGPGLRRRDDRRRRHRGDACTCGAPSPRRAS